MKNIHESGEMYLETIYILSKNNNPVRSVDVCDYMGYSKPSVSRAMSILKQGGYVSVNNDGHLSLTDAGLELAEKIYERHHILTKILTSLGVDEATASDDACRIEHVISEESFNALKKHLSDKASQ